MKKGDDVFVERIHVLHEPLIRRVIDATRVMDQSEIGIGTELGFLEFGMLFNVRGKRGEEGKEGRREYIK